MHAKIDEFIKSNLSDEQPNLAQIQLGKLNMILQSESKTIVCNDEDYGVYKNGIKYGGHEGSQYTIDVDAFSKDIDNCLKNWWIPTAEGPMIDIWLLK